MIVVAIIGILAAVAIPAFMRYMKRAKTSEATQGIAGIFRGAVAYYEAEHPNRAGTARVKQFPRNVGPTPTLTNLVGGRKYTSLGGSWNDAAWVALSFAVYEPRYYAYQFVSSGTADAAEFTARAQGDLDGDGLFSTFERSASVDVSASVSGASGIYVDNELE